MDEFDWMQSRAARRPSNTEWVREDEMRRRATLLAHLGYSEAAALARLRANVEWEYERVGKANITKKLATVVGEAYKRAGGPAPGARAKNGASPSPKKKLIKRAASRRDPPP